MPWNVCVSCVCVWVRCRTRCCGLLLWNKGFASHHSHLLFITGICSHNNGRHTLLFFTLGLFTCTSHFHNNDTHITVLTEMLWSSLTVMAMWGAVRERKTYWSHDRPSNCFTSDCKTHLIWFLCPAALVVLAFAWLTPFRCRVSQKLVHRTSVYC